MLTKNIRFSNFIIKSKNFNIRKIFENLKRNYYKGQLKILLSLSENYNYSFDKKLINKYKNSSNFRVIGMGGSILGTQAIYYFLKDKIKKNFSFTDNLQNQVNENKKNEINIIVSKSGDTLETISNSNILLKKNNKNIFITENNNNYLRNLANKITAEVVEHKNYIGGRYSVLSEVGMLPATINGLKRKKI